MSEEMREIPTSMFIFNLNHHNVTLVEFIAGCSLCCFPWIFLQPGSFLQGCWIVSFLQGTCLEHNEGDNQVWCLLVTTREKTNGAGLWWEAVINQDEEADEIFYRHLE